VGLYQKKKQKTRNSQAPVAHTYNPSYSEGRDQEDRSSKPALGKQLMRPYLKNNQHKKGLTEWTCLPSQATQEGENWRIVVSGQPWRKRLSNLISINKSCLWWCALVIPAMLGSINKRSVVQVILGKK
jgi:hypothetical protein